MPHSRRLAIVIHIVLALGLTCGRVAAQDPGADDPASAVAEIDANAEERARAEEEEQEDGGAALAEQIFAETEDCVQISRIRRTEVLDDRTIVFYMVGSDIYLNRLPHRCSGLRNSRSFGYDVRTTRLCNVDTIRVVDNFGGDLRPGVACGLGKFAPVTEEQLALVREGGLAAED